MRLLILLLVSCVSLQTPARSASVTANELAQHLGVSVWRIPQAALPKRYSASLALVHDGKQTALPNGGSSGFTFDAAGDLVVCAHEFDGKMLITLACGGTSASPYTSGGLSIGPFEVKHEITSQPALGSHLLCANYQLKKDTRNPLGIRIATGKIEDATDGLVLVVTEAD